MKLKINLRNILRATLGTMLVSAAFHLAASLFFAIKTGNGDYANMFNVIGVSWFFPNLGTGALNSLFGIIFVVGAGVIVYFIMQRHDSLQARK